MTDKENLNTAGIPEIFEDRVHDDNYVLNELKRYFFNNRDAFGNDTTPRTNVLDLAAHYPYNPERFTVTVDGTRQLIQYGDIAQYNHTGDTHELKPNAGETVIFESAERPRYVVAYELATTFAFSVNQSLQSGDSIKIGLYDGSNGWYMEHDGSHTDKQADFVLERGGTEVYRKTDIDIHKSIQTFARLRLQTAWYDITRNRWERSFSENGIQKNPVIGRFSADDSRGSKVGNLPAHFEVTASSSTDNLILNAGSAAQVNLGNTTALKRSKTTVHTDAIDTTGSWIPLRAYRIDPNREIINVQLTDADIGEYSANADVEVLIQSFAKSKVLDSGGNELVDSDFSTPNEFNSQNNPLETSTAAEQIPDSSGTVQTSVSDPGGWQLGRSELFTGSGNTVSAATTSTGGIKRPIYERDYMVILGKSANTGDVTYQLEFEEDW